MKKQITARFFTLFASLFFALFMACAFASCMNNMNEMLGDYNSDSQEDDTQPPVNGTDGTSADQGEAESKPIDDPEFDPNDMLKDKYLVAENMTITLAAPVADYYEWNFDKITEEILNSTYGIKEIRYTPLNVSGVIPVYNRALILYLPKISHVLVPGDTYRLRLTVGMSDGRRYSDEAILAIYKVYEQ